MKAVCLYGIVRVIPGESLENRNHGINPVLLSPYSRLGNKMNERKASDELGKSGPCCLETVADVGGPGMVLDGVCVQRRVVLCSVRISVHESAGVITAEPRLLVSREAKMPKRTRDSSNQHPSLIETTSTIPPHEASRVLTTASKKKSHETKIPLSTSLFDTPLFATSIAGFFRKHEAFGWLS